MLYISNTNLLGNWFETETAIAIVKGKYMHEGEKDFRDVAKRVASISESAKQVEDAMLCGDFLPAGRTIYGVGTGEEEKVCTSNCFILRSPKDDLHDINSVINEMDIIASRGGGSGVNLSNLRPKGAKVRNAARSSTGAVSYVKKFNDNLSITAKNGRRGALLVGLEVNHPDIMEFINCKTDDSSIQQANLSVLVTDDFMQAVCDDTETTLYFKVESTGEEISKTVKAREIFDKLCENAWDWAEPGILFLDTIRKQNLLSAYPSDEYRIDITNPCAEYCGNEYNSCNLGSINLYNCVRNPFTVTATFNYAHFRYLVGLGVSFLNEVLDYGYSKQPLDQNRKCIDDWRAIGLGFFGMADMFNALGIRYGSLEAIELMDKILREMKISAISMSNELAKEKGSFGKFDAEKLLASPMFSDVGEDLKANIIKFGLRNGSLLSIAPTGSISTMCGLSGGAEPLFQLSYLRTTHALHNDKENKYFRVVGKSVEHLMAEKGINIPLDHPNFNEELRKVAPFLIASHELNPNDRARMQGVIQKYVDNAVSSTINLVKEATVEEVKEAVIHAWRCGCKGVTFFRNGCKRSAILITNEEAKAPAMKNPNPAKKVSNGDGLYNSVSPAKTGLRSWMQGARIVKSTACVPKMYVHVYHADGKLLEVFVNVAKGCKTNIATVTRLVSLALRSGVKIKEVMKQLKVEECIACRTAQVKERMERGKTHIENSCPSAIASAIQDAITKFNLEVDSNLVINITDDETVPIKEKHAEEIHYLECPECHKKTLIPEGKCFTCIECHYQKCD